MPVSYEDLVKKAKENPKQFQEDKEAIKQFSIVMFGVAQKLQKNINDDFQYQIGKNLEIYSDALDKVTQDPTNEKNRQEIEKALDTLFTMENYLGKSSTEVSLDKFKQNIYIGMLVLDDKNKNEKVENGLSALNRLCEFGIKEQQLFSGQVFSEKDLSAEREAWNKKREKDKKAVEDRIRREEEERNKRLQQQRAAQERADAQRKADEEKIQREMAEREKKRLEREKKAQEEQLKKIKEKAKTEQQRLNDQEKYRKHMNAMMKQSRAPGLTDFERIAAMAEAVAIQRELDRVHPAHGKEPMDLSKINQSMQWVADSGALRVAQKLGRLDDYTSYKTVKDLDKRIKQVEDDVNLCEAGTEKSKSGKRAGKIFRQMDRTWRLMGSSDEFKRANQAIEEVSKLTIPSQTDHYVAGEMVKRYVSKNLRAAKSDVGMTRMACSLAFLKQTMPEDAFRTYCNNLNYQRGLRPNIGENGEQTYDKSDPRCFVPEEIGTIKEVYDIAHERIHKLSVNNKTPTMRDYAVLTALKRLEARNANRENGGKDVVVEHEALQKEIDAVMRDRRFQEGMKKDPLTLMTLAWYNRLDKIEGYTNPIDKEVQDKIDAIRKQEEDERKQQEAEKKALEEKKKKELEEENKRKAEEEERQKKAKEEEDKRKQEQAQKEAAEKKFREENKQIFDLYYEDVRPKVEELNAPLRVALYGLDSDEDVESALDLAATLVALAEYQRKAKAEGANIPEYWVNKEALKQRVETLKKDQIIQDKGVQLRNGTYLPGEMKANIAAMKKSPKFNRFSEELQAIQPILRLSLDMEIDYRSRVEEREHPKEKKKPTVGEGYQVIKEQVEKVIAGELNYMDAAPIIAKAVCFRELERKGEAGLNTEVDVKENSRRYNQLKNDRLIRNVSQSLKGPTGQKALANALNGKPDTVRAFAEFVDDMYQKAVLEKQMKDEARKLKAQGGQKAEKAENEKKVEGEQKVEEAPMFLGNL